MISAIAEPRSRPDRRAVAETIVRWSSRAISVSPGVTTIVAMSPSRAQRPGATGTRASASAATPGAPTGAGSVTRTGHARAPRGTTPGRRDRRPYGATSSASCVGARAPRGALPPPARRAGSAR
jgi:hypothetical protein